MTKVEEIINELCQVTCTPYDCIKSLSKDSYHTTQKLVRTAIEAAYDVIIPPASLDLFRKMPIGCLEEYLHLIKEEQAHRKADAAKEA